MSPRSFADCKMTTDRIVRVFGNPNGNNEDDWGFNIGLAEARRLVGPGADFLRYLFAGRIQLPQVAA